MTATAVAAAWSCTVRLVVADERVLRRATEDLIALLARVDAAASRFRADSALSRANARAGRPVAVPRLLVDLVAAGLDAAAPTDGAVDPTLGLAMHRIGYDRDITAVPRARRRGRRPPLRRPLRRLARGAAASRGRPADRPGRHRPRPRRHRQGLDGRPRRAAPWPRATAPPSSSSSAGTSRWPVIRPGGWTVQVAEREGGPGSSSRCATAA